MADRKFSKHCTNFKDLSGRAFGRLTVLKLAKEKLSGGYCWICQCACGEITTVRSSCLVQGQTTSCGCYARELSGIRAPSKTHGMTGTREHYVWRSAKARCFSKNSQGFPDYGGRGITMCPEWAQSFEAFFRDMGKCPEGHSLDRINNDGNYEPGNCRWATPAQQIRNTRRTVMITHNGKTMCLKDWATETGISYLTLSSRRRRGRPLFKL